MKEFEVQHGSFVDNLAWSGGQPRQLLQALSVSLDLLQRLRLPVDWRKSCCFRTTRELRSWWKQQACHALPQGVELEVVSEARSELGVAFRYDAKPKQHLRSLRLLEGKARLAHLQDQPRGLLEKAKLIQVGVWPQCLYQGLEGHCLARHEFAALRTAAAAALVGGHSSVSPLLALGPLGTITTSVQDPSLYCLMAQLRALRRMWNSHPGTAASVQFFASRPSPKVPPCVLCCTELA